MQAAPLVMGMMDPAVVSNVVPMLDVDIKYLVREIKPRPFVFVKRASPVTPIAAKAVIGMIILMAESLALLPKTDAWSTIIHCTMSIKHGPTVVITHALAA